MELWRFLNKHFLFSFFDDIFQIIRLKYKSVIFKTLLMKNTCMYFILFFSFSFFFACSSDDDNSPENTDFTELIIGEWETSSTTIDGMLSENPCATGELLEFDADGTFSTGYWPAGSNCASVIVGGDYNINGSIIEFSNSMSDDYEAEIITLTTSTLVYKYDRFDGEVIRSFSK